MSDATTITISVIGLFALLALIALTRSLLTRKESGWRRYRVGLFIERDPTTELASHHQATPATAAEAAASSRASVPIGCGRGGPSDTAAPAGTQETK